MKKEKKMQRELATIRAMITIYCRAHHHFRDILCHDCSELLNYATKRLRLCPFQENKPTCSKCSVHCYKPEMREKIRDVMRFSGPRMMYHHPIMALRHLLDSHRKTDQFCRRKTGSIVHSSKDLEERRTSE